MWNGLAMFGDEKSMTMLLPLGALGPNGAIFVRIPSTA